MGTQPLMLWLVTMNWRSAGAREGFVPFFLNLNDTVLESMVNGVPETSHDVETLTPSR